MAIIQKLPFQEKFPEDFLKEIEVSNSEKTLDAPKALILFASYDFENISKETPTHFFIFNIAKTHRVAMQIIHEINQIKTSIESAIRFDGKSQQIDLLVFNAHGDNQYIRISEKESYSANAIKQSDFGGLSPNAEIFLTSCNAGNILAQKIADVTKHIVFAPKDVLSSVNTSFTFCEKHHLYEMQAYNTKHQPIGFIFQEGKPPVLCNESSEIYFGALREFLIKKSKEGNSDAQFYLGAIEATDGKIKEAKEFYKQAAAKGYSKAQYNLGVIEQKDGKIKEAKEYYKQAAAQGHPNALFYLGIIEQKDGKIKEAKECYRQAAMKGHANALFYLGYIEEQLGNKNNAIQYYLKAAKHGNSDAQLRLKLIEEKEKISPTKRKLPVD